MHFHQLFHQWKSDTRTSLIEKILIYQILKTDKQWLLFVFRDTDTLILHTDRNHLFIFPDKHRNHLAIRRIFKCIGKQIEYNLFQLIGIHPKIKMFLFGLEQEINPMFLGHSFKIFHHLTDERYNIHPLHLHLHLLILNLAEVQNLIDKTKHPIGVPFNHH